jgi:hypothetical protein
MVDSWPDIEKETRHREGASRHGQHRKSTDAFIEHSASHLMEISTQTMSGSDGMGPPESTSDQATTMRAGSAAANASARSSLGG